MAITKKDIEHIADLARLELTEDEKEKFVGQLSSILDYVAQLGEVDTQDVVVQYPVQGLSNSMADDEARPSDEETRTLLLNAMPDRAGDFLKVKGVFE